MFDKFNKLYKADHYNEKKSRNHELIYLLFIFLRTYSNNTQPSVLLTGISNDKLMGDTFM